MAYKQSGIAVHHYQRENNMLKRTRLLATLHVSPEIADRPFVDAFWLLFLLANDQTQWHLSWHLVQNSRSIPMILIVDIGR